MDALSGSFTYFLGPISEMSGLADGDQRCDYCGEVGPCFDMLKASWHSTKEVAAPRYGCLSCLSRGRFQFWHDTEIGFLDPDGLHAPEPYQTEKPKSFDRTVFRRLLQTPNFITYQQELWLVHCDDFMVYLGEWKPADFRRAAGDVDGRELFLQMTDRDSAHLWDEASKPGEELAEWYAAYYAFRCRHCGKLRGNWDCP